MGCLFIFLRVISTSGSDGCVYETFGISKHFLVKLQVLLTRAVSFDKPLTAKCFIHDVTSSASVYLHNCPNLSFLLIGFVAIISIKIRPLCFQVLNIGFQIAFYFVEDSW